VGFVVDKAALGQVSFENYCFPYQAFHRQFHTHHHHPLSSRADTINRPVAASVIVDSIPLHFKKEKKKFKAKERDFVNMVMSLRVL
jgi:hypothetical protein